MNNSHENPICPSNINKIKKYIGTQINCVFEIGAYDGVDIQEIKSLFGDNCIIHAFEPDNESFQILSKLYESNSVICNNIALSNFNGIADLIKIYDSNLSNNEQYNRSLWHKTTGSLIEFNENFEPYWYKNIKKYKIQVPVITLDSYCSINNIRPDILLIDTQGSEYEILDGAKSILSSVQLIFTEWSTKDLYKNQKYLSDIELLLKQYNFTLIEKIDLWNDFHGDAIFIKS